MMLIRSIMWNLKPNGKVVNLEVKNHNGILLLWIMDLRLIGWNGIISSLGNSLSYLHHHCKANLGDLFLRVNVNGL